MKRWMVPAAVGALVVGTLAAVPIMPAFAATSCAVDYVIASQWSGHFQVNLTLRNTGDAWNGWRLQFNLPSGQSVSANNWGATWTTGTSAVSATSLSYNGNVPTGGTVASVGFVGDTSSGPNTVPASFIINGVTCGGNSSPSPSPSRSVSPSPSQSPSRSASPPPSSSSSSSSSAPPPPGVAPPLHVSGNRLLTDTGATYRLLGTNRSGGEFACIQGNGMWDGPMDQASLNAMKTWRIRAVRVPLNEECWLGAGVVPAGDIPAGGTQGAAYQQAVKDYVSLLISNGMTPIVEMHWSFGAYNGNSAGACTDRNNPKAACQKPMPDAQFGPMFWTSVANAFKGNNAVVFDLFNEPFPERATGNETTGWTCWRDGGTCAGIPFQVAGFQSLVSAVRATGATNVIQVGGLAFSNDLTQWLQFKPTDPTGNLMAFAHIYNFNSCSSTSCFDSQMAPVAAQVPLALTEIGENDCAHGFIDTVMGWADSHGVGYLGWTWNADFQCSSGPGLITDYNGTATNFGIGLKNHLATV
jgi:endoglucanase